MHLTLLLLVLVHLAPGHHLLQREEILEEQQQHSVGETGSRRGVEQGEGEESRGKWREVSPSCQLVGE